MSRKVDPQRLARLNDALKKAGADETISLIDFAVLWGVTKQRFVTVRNQIVGFPAPAPGKGNEYIYNLRAALESAIAHEGQHAAKAASKKSAMRRVMGEALDDDEDDEEPLSVNEAYTAFRLRTQIEAQEREQGLFIPVAEVMEVSSKMFERVSAFMSSISSLVDPNGLLPAVTRRALDDRAKEELLRLYADAKGLLEGDIQSRTNARNPASHGRPRRARARRTRG